VWLVGLNNSYGEQNCFLNVCLQSFMALQCVRDQFNYLARHMCPPPRDPLTRELLRFSQEYDEAAFRGGSAAFSPRGPRKELFKVAYRQQRFVINETDDACEAFEALVSQLHKGARIKLLRKGGGPERGGECDAKEVYCIAHDTFFIDYEIVKVCKCGLRDAIMRSDPSASWVMTLYPEDAFK
jgi:hypothetical protein